MFDPQALLPFVSIMLFAVAFGEYAVQMIDRESRPHLVSFSIWTLITAFYAFSFIEMSNGVAIAFILFGFLGYGGICLFGFLTSYSKKLTEDGEILLVLGLILILVWKLSGPVFSEIVLVGLLAVSFAPTILEVWKDPRKEKSPAWWFWAISFGLVSVYIFLLKGGWATSMALPMVVTLLFGSVGFLSSERRKKTWVDGKQRAIALIEMEEAVLREEIRQLYNIREVTLVSSDSRSRPREIHIRQRNKEIDKGRALLMYLKRRKEKLERQLGTSL